MHHFTSQGKRPYRTSKPQISVELLEDRRLLSGSPVVAPDTTSSPVVALDVNATAGRLFYDVVGNWTVAGGVPKPRTDRVVALAIVNWGDGRQSRARLIDDGSGVVQIKGAHVFATAGTFQTVVKIEEIVLTERPLHLTEVGEGDATAVVAPRPHLVSLKGNFTGTYTVPLGNPDARSYEFTGSGTARAMGAVDLAGTITPPGFIRSAPATGELTLTGADGTVTIDLIGHVQNGGSPLPQLMVYTITDATGSFVSARARGLISIALNPDTNSFLMVIH